MTRATIGRFSMPLMAVVVLLLVAIVPAAPSNSMALPGCPATCGAVEIPYPFGIGKNCSRDEAFEITCKDGTTPVIAGTDYPVLNISLASSEALVRLPVASWCNDDPSGKPKPGFNPRGLYRISNTRNELVAIGCGTVAFMTSLNRSIDSVSGCMAFCRSAESATDGVCSGVGCCRVGFPQGLSDNLIMFENKWSRPGLCSYSFVVERDSYVFRRADINGGLKGTDMPVWLDWAIRPPNGSAAALTCGDAVKNSTSYACQGQRSNCTVSLNGPGYSCQCPDGYEGNPFSDGAGGCTNINECAFPDKYTCHGQCHDTDGSYDCTCPRGTHGKPKEAPCEPNLPRVARIIIGATCGIAFLIVLAIFMFMVHHKRKLREFFKRNGGPMLENINNIKIYRKEEMNQITKNYSIVLGKGGFGEVYRGTIDNKQQVAVKRCTSLEEERKKDFANEVIIQSRISHKNVIRLVGCCLEVDVPMLVYEFAPRGSLYDVLHGTTNDKKNSLPLGTRLDIAIDSAEGLSYMHSSASQKILHGDVKSGNILLDENFTPKVSDFGTSRLLSNEKKNTMSVIGDIKYIDPVYMKTGRLDEKSDVYSFGVVLLELITRKMPRYDGNNSLPINFIKLYTSNERAREMYDVDIASPQNIECLEKVGGIAVACLKDDMDERPNMKQVVEHLQLVKREWKQGLVTHGDRVADEISTESPLSLTMDATGAETPGYSPLLK